MSGKNVIASGQYAKSLIQKSTFSNWAYIQKSGKPYYITSLTCHQIEPLTSGSNDALGGALVGGVLAGTTGAVIGAASAGTSHLVKIVWNDGTTSIAEVSNDILNALLIGMNERPTKHDIEQAAKKDQLIKIVCAIITAVIALIWLVTYLAGR